MSKKILSFVALIMIIMLPNKVKAYCSNEEIIRRSSLAKNMSVSYDYIEENGSVSFNVVITNLQPELYIKDVYNQATYYYSGSELILYNFKPNKNYRFDVYGTGECNQRLYSHYITTPGYNPYYNDPVCTGVTHSICQKWVNINYNYDTFVSEVNKIKAKTNKQQQEITEEEPMGIYDYLIKFFISYYYIILPIIIIVCITIIIQKRKKDDLF